MAKLLTNLKIKYKGLATPAKCAFWFTICGFLQKGISFITTPIFTRLLSTSQYGVVSVYNSWVSLLSIFCTLNLFSGGFNNGMLDYENTRDRYLSSIQGLITVITLFWVGVYMIGQEYLNQLFGMDIVLVFVMFVEIIFSAALSLWSARQRYEFHYRSLLIVTLLNAFMASFFSVIAVVLCNREIGAEAKIISHATVTVIICGSIYLLNLVKGKTFCDLKIWKGALLFNLPLLPHYLSTMVLNQADRIMISKMIGESEAGIYSVAYSVAMILNIAVTALNNSIAPWLYGKLKRKDYSGIANVTNIIFAAIAIMLAMLIAFSPECISVFAGEKYTDAIYIIPSVSTSLYFILMYQIFANVEFYWRKNKFIAYASVSGAILNVILNYIGIKKFGYVAAGYTTLICYAVFGIAHYIFTRKICDSEMDGATVFDVKAIISIACILVVFSVVMTIFYDKLVLRYLVLAVLLGIAFVNRKRIKNIKNTLKER